MQQARVLLEQRIANSAKSRPLADPTIDRVQGLACDILNLTPSDLDDILSVADSDEIRSQVNLSKIACYVLVSSIRLILMISDFR